LKTLAILGASGHGKVVADAALSTGIWQQVIFYDDAWPTKTKNGQSDVVGNTQTLLNLQQKPEVVVAVGNNKTRLAKQNDLIVQGFTIATVVHSNTVISPSVKMGHGTVVMAGAVISADVSIGDACIINTNAVVEHDCMLGNAVHISPGACLAGAVIIGDGSWIGIGASVIQLKKLGINVMVGAGAAVVTDLPNGVTAVGVPARILK
jgi:sugar O-acyltransferase (sialic acid O-acetyltransferase NeuD family)